MSKVYLVTSGAYSDFRVVAVFADRETAQAFVEKLVLKSGYRDYEDIDERELVTTVPEWVDEWRSDGDEAWPAGRWDFEPRYEVEHGPIRLGRTPDEARKAAQDVAARRAAVEAGLDLP